MFESIFETVVMGSNVAFLSIPEDDYFLVYDSVTKKAAEEITEDYFKMRNRDGIAHVKHIEHDEPSHRIKITLEIEENKDWPRPAYIVPDTLNNTRNNE